MRRALDRLYRASLVAAASALVLILLIVLVQVGFNLLDRLLQLSGTTPVGLLVPSYAEICGYLLAAASFLALGGSFRAASHIRVTLFLSRMPARLRGFADGLSLVLALAASCYFAFFLGRLTWQSMRFGDVSPGLVPIPIWLPQSVMTLGVVVLAVALADELWAALRGRVPAYRQAEMTAEVESVQRAAEEV